MFNWFNKKDSQVTVNPLLIDIHSHLLPGIDDGVQTFEQAEEIILGFQKLGYTKLITSPHIMSDSYPNTYDGIKNKLDELKKYLLTKNITIPIDAVAEYYLDEQLVSMVNDNKPMLTFGKNYLLFETNFINEPFNLKEFIFIASTKGYKLVLAHPERYMYLHNNLQKAEDLLDRGVLFQINISSLTAYYSKPAQQTAQKLIDKGWVHFLGSDCHHLQHFKLTEAAQRLKYFQKALSLPLLNNTL